MPEEIAVTPEHDESQLHYKVCYADTDAGGVVYHARYIEMVERARNKVMYMAGFSFADLREKHDTVLVVHKVNGVYHAPAFLEDSLTLRTRVIVRKPSRTVWLTQVIRDDLLLATVSIEMVAIHANTRQLRPHPDRLLEKLASFS
jgi:acyl-CoA thioester hydrolase